MEEIKLLNKKELAEILRVDPKTIYRFRKQGMPVIRFGLRTVRYSLEDCVKWAESKDEVKGFDIPNMSPSPSPEA